MSTNQETQNLEGVGWGQYAHRENMSQFGNLESSKENPWPFANTGNQDLGKEGEQEKEKQDSTSLPMVNAPKDPCLPPEPISTEKQGPVVHANSRDTPQANFGKPSPTRHGAKTALWVQSDAQVVEDAPSPERSLEDLYNEHPEKRLEGGIDPSTMNLAANVVLQLVNEAGYRWLNKWCPHMDLREVSESIRVEDLENNHGKKYNVPPGAIDKSILTTSLADMYRQCRSIHLKDSGDIQFPRLLELIDKSVIFVGALKDDKCKKLLQKTKSTFQWIPVGLAAKKAHMVTDAKAGLQEVNRTFNNNILNHKIGSEVPHQKRQTDEIGILDKISAEYELQCKGFETEMLDWLDVLLASTNASLSKPTPRSQLREPK